MYSPETVSRIETLRAIAQTRRLTTAEQQESIQLVRADRIGASYASAGSKVRKTATKTDGADILAAMLKAVGKAAS